MRLFTDFMEAGATLLSWLRRPSVRCTLALLGLAWVLPGLAVLGPEWEPGFARCDVGLIPTQPAGQLLDTTRHEGFAIAQSATPIADTPVAEVFDLLEARRWIEAIQTIESIDDQPGAYILDAHGMVRTAGSVKSALLDALPADARRAFRKLNEPAARAKLERAHRLSDLRERADAYARLVDLYAFCDAAAEAGVALGDLCFEQGDFARAAEHYRFADEHPAKLRSDPQLTARRLMTLNRAGDTAALRQLAASLQLSATDQAVTLAGRSTTLGQLLDELMPRDPSDDSTSEHNQPNLLAIPRDDSRSLTRTLIDPSLHKANHRFAQTARLNNVIDTLLAPTVAVDGHRLFTLALGSVARIDPDTGKTLWRFGDPDAQGKRLQQQIHQLQAGYPQSLAVDGDTVFALLPSEQQVSHSRLVALDSTTGSLRWHIDDAMGEPLAIDQRVYLVSKASASSNEIRLIAIDRATGAILATIELGKAVSDPRMNQPTAMSPRLTATDRLILVQTNNGALIALHRESYDIAWALNQRLRVSGLGQRRMLGYTPVGAIAQHTGNVVAHGNHAFAKDTRGNTLHAIDLDTGSLVWTAATDEDAAIVGVDHQRVYVLGEQLVALDRATGERRWWTRHAGPHAGQPVLTRTHALLAGRERTCLVDLETGRLLDYRDNLDGPANLHRLTEHLVQIRGNDLTIYPVRKQMQP